MHSCVVVLALALVAGAVLAWPCMPSSVVWYVVLMSAHAFLQDWRLYVSLQEFYAFVGSAEGR